jgi:hypothetical protein
LRDNGIVWVPFAQRRMLVTNARIGVGSGHLFNSLKSCFSSGFSCAARRFICFIGLAEIRERLLDVVEYDEAVGLMLCSC